MAYQLSGGTPSIVTNGTAGLEPVNIGSLALQATPSAAGELSLNLPATATVVAAANLPSANAATATYTGKTSLVAYDNVGAEVTLDIYATKSAGSLGDCRFDHATAGAGGSFPYTSGPLASTTLTFDATGPSRDGQPHLAVADNSERRRLYAGHDADQSARHRLHGPQRGRRRQCAERRAGCRDHRRRAALRRVPERHADGHLSHTPGHRAEPRQPRGAGRQRLSRGVDAGDINIGFAGTSGFGTLVASALEQSTVDLASELTSMIESERSYTANSKVFQTGAELMDVLVNLKR